MQGVVFLYRYSIRVGGGFIVGKTTILLQSTTAFKEALATYAQEHNVSVALVVREAVANVIGYDLTQESVQQRDGRKKYATAIEREDARKERQKAHRKFATQLMAALEHEQHLADVLGIQTSLLKKGISLD
jgi:hypothetical protein